jgi:hypothetical protein
MRKSAIATSAILTLSFVALLADVTQQGYMRFTSVSDIKKTLPNITPPQFAKVLEGNDKGCLTKTSQTKAVTVTQLRTLRQLTDPDAIVALLGNPLCQTEKGATWITESGKRLNLNFNKVLDYDFSTDTPQSLTNKERTPAKTNGSADRSLQRGVSPSSP